jgi:hypothetical protein
MCISRLWELEANKVEEHNMITINRNTKHGVDTIALRTTADKRPKFFLCRGCDRWHPLGFGGDCRDDAMRFSSNQLDDLFPDANKDGWPDWVEVDEHTGR